MTCKTCTPDGLCTMRCYDRISKNGTNMQRTALYGSLMSAIDIREKLKRRLAELKASLFECGERLISLEAEYKTAKSTSIIRAEIAEVAGQRLQANNQVIAIRKKIDEQILYVKTLANAVLLTGDYTISQQSTLEIESSRKCFLASDYTKLINHKTGIYQPEITKEKVKENQLIKPDGKKLVAARNRKSRDVTASTLSDAARGLKPYKLKNQSYEDTLAMYKRLSSQGAI